MATVDDVYNLISGQVIPRLDTIAPHGWAGMSPSDPTTGDWAKLASDESLIMSPAWRLLTIWQQVVGNSPNIANELLSLDDGTLGKLIHDLKAAVVRTLHSPD